MCIAYRFSENVNSLLVFIAFLRGGKNDGGLSDENVNFPLVLSAVLTGHSRIVHLMMVLKALLKGKLEAVFGRVGVKLKFVHL